MAAKRKPLIFKSFEELRNSKEWQTIAAHKYMEQKERYGRSFEGKRREQEIRARKHKRQQQPQLERAY